MLLRQEENLGSFRLFFLQKGSALDHSASASHTQMYFLFSDQRLFLFLITFVNIGFGHDEEKTTKKEFSLLVQVCQTESVKGMFSRHVRTLSSSWLAQSDHLIKVTIIDLKSILDSLGRVIIQSPSMQPRRSNSVG